MKIKYISLFFILLSFLFVGAGCVIPDTIVTQPPIGQPQVPSVELNNPPSASPPVDTKTPSSLPDFVTIIARVRPSVVAITTEVSVVSRSGRSFTQQGAGSGWIIDKTGVIITNNHVVEGAKNITVTLEDGRTYPSEWVHTDPVADLAIVKINAPNLSALKLGDSSKLQMGEWVVAIGNSLGMGISATKGIVSALDVSFSTSPGQNLYGLIQTDAAINPGNSGGPLLNLQGEVVGINSVKIAQVGVEGMGYAISIKESKPIIDQLINVGYVVRPYLGAGLYTVDQYAIARYKLAVKKGVLVTDVIPGSPAETAGLKAGDVITFIDNTEVSDAGTQLKLLNSYPIGQKMQITYWRGPTQYTIHTIITQSPLPPQ